MLKNIKHLALVALISTSACSSYDPYDNEFRDDEFTKGLSKYYLDLAESESAMGDKVSEGVFRTKSENINYYYMPENVDLYDLEYSDRSELEQARDNLVSVLNTTRSTKPYKSAWAQSRFDCWLEQAEERTDKTCKSQFVKAIDELTKVEAPKPAPVVAPKVEPVAVQQPEPTADMQELVTTNIYFDLDKDTVKSEYDYVISRVAEAQQTYNIPVVIMGYADTTGSKSYNKNISQRRAANVSKALQDAGVSKDQIRTFAFGEEKLAVQTADGEKEQRNRRAQIVLDVE